MASRQEEKEARRQARLEQEAAERKVAARNKRLQFLFGGVLVVGIVVAVVLVVTGGGGIGKEDKTSKVKEVASTGAKLPAIQITDEKAAAKAAGCTLTNPPDEGRNHQSKVFTESDYKTNPPTSGNHYPVWAQDGIYDPGNEPQLGKLVHTLEHGRIDVQYKPGTPKATVSKLEELLSESDSGYHMLLYRNDTNMPYAVAATAWDHALECPTMNDKVFDAIRTFRTEHIDKGPEKVA